MYKGPPHRQEHMWVICELCAIFTMYKDYGWRYAEILRKLVQVQVTCVQNGNAVALFTQPSARFDMQRMDFSHISAVA